MARNRTSRCTPRTAFAFGAVLFLVAGASAEAARAPAQQSVRGAVQQHAARSNVVQMLQISARGAGEAGAGTASYESSSGSAFAGSVFCLRVEARVAVAGVRIERA